MLGDAMDPLKDHNHTKSFIVEAINAEKQLWTLIRSKGLLHMDVQELYHITRSSYEKIILSDHKLAELQDIEYSLWKVHYKHIDEFRNRIRQGSANADYKNLAVPQNVTTEQHNSGNLVQGFRSFLTEAIEFYQDLITKIRISYGLPKELLFFEDGCFTSSMESTEMRRCRFSCHRCLVYLGDLARYRELYKNPGTEKCNWSIAATHYLNASMIWPDSGNPQNQLAVLATYIGDEFLALYHCIRSLAAKDPFPDAWDNLNLLFEKNGSSHLHSLSTETTFDFNEPCKRSMVQTKARSSDSFSTSHMHEATEDVACSEESSLWSLIVRMISIFYIHPSLKDFSCTFSSTVRELEILLALNDVRLKDVLESYQHLDATRIGPFRALQLVSVLIFTIHTLSESSNLQKPKHIKDMEQPVLIQLVLASTFVCMGRIVDRCAKSNPVDCSPLLPAILVFVECLADMLDIAETYEADEKYANVIYYFFGAFVHLLNQFDDKVGEFESLDCTVLWEDYELRGFTPIGHAHAPLDFSPKQRNRFEDRLECQIRIHRILLAAMKVVNRSNGSQKWIVYEKIGRRFCAMESKKLPDMRQSEAVESSSDPKVRELQQQLPLLKHDTPLCGATKESGLQDNEGDQSNLDAHGNTSPVEEDEVILFKPIARYNSAPLYIPVATSCDTVPSGECLRRGSSSVRAQNLNKSDPSSFHSIISTSSCNKTFWQKETIGEDSVKYPFSETYLSAGPPSLSAWVLNRETSGSAGNKGTNDMGKYSSGCIDIASSSLTGLSISGTAVSQQDIQVTSPTSASHHMYCLLSEGDSVIGSGDAPVTTHYSAPPYSAPVPSAPLLPYDATWFCGDSSNYPECKVSEEIKEIPNFLCASQVNSQFGTQGPLNFDPGVPEFNSRFTPLPGRTDSTPWLHQYWDNFNLGQANDNIWPLHFYTPNLQEFQDRDVSRLGPYDRRPKPSTGSPRKYLEGSPLHPGFSLAYGADEQVRDKLSYGYQVPSPFRHGAALDLRSEQQLLPDEQVRDKLGCGYQVPSPFGYGAALDLRSEQQLLLQYLKEKEWRLNGSPKAPN